MIHTFVLSIRLETQLGDLYGSMQLFCNVLTTWLFM